MKVTKINSILSFKANKMPKSQAEYFNKKLLSSDSVDIFCHVATDEDAFNSAKIMYDYLRDNGIKPRIICNNADENYGYDNKTYDIIDINKNKTELQRAKTALCLDFSDPIRIRGKAFEYLSSFPKSNVFCIDHHETANPITDSNIIKTEEIVAPKIKQIKNGYLDTTAKSAASILVRFFEALNISMSDNQKESAFCAMADDMNKEKLINISNGQILKSDEFEDNINAKEVFENIENSISDKKKTEILSHLDVLSRLNSKEKAFRMSLYKNIKITPNKKFAYVIIPPDDKNWKKIGGDTPTASKILRDFRTRILEHKQTDEFIDKDLLSKIQEIQAIAVFYPDTKAGRYRVSMHSNKDYAFRIIDLIREQYYSPLKAGGHPNRAGGSTQTLDKNKCAKWANNFICAGQNLHY